MTAFRPSLCEPRAMPFPSLNSLIVLSKFRRLGRASAAPGRRNCRRRQILPGRLHSVNHRGVKLPVHTPRDPTMRIYGPNATTLGTPSANVRKTSSTGFSLPDAAAATQESRAAVAPKAAANIDALLALQGIEEDPAERRKRSVQRGKGAL